jgi:3-phosphoshikimate 1-carboxyvinyltransferase
LERSGDQLSSFSFDFSDCPDIAQTAVVTAAGLGLELSLTGLESLRIKETDRIQALQQELKKLGVGFVQENGKWCVKGKVSTADPVTISTYEDHRMAMSFAPLSLVTSEIVIEDPGG